MQGLWYVALLAAFASLNSCNLGFDLGVTAGAILGMQADLGLTDDQVEIFVGIVDLSGTLGAACSFLKARRHTTQTNGRKHSCITLSGLNVFI